MGRIGAVLGDIGRLNELGAMDTPVHRLDPRAKVVATLLFVVAVTSFPKYEILGLLPFFVFPVAMVSAGNLPTGAVLVRLVPALPFALFVGVFNPILDREIVAQVGSWGITGGWISFASILLRFVLTVGAAIILVATTGFEAVCLALVRLRVPRLLVMQLLFLYRYLFVLVDEADRVVRAYQLRAVGNAAVGRRVYGSMVGQWLLRTLDRGQRVHRAMLCRGFDGEIRLIRRFRMGIRGFVFLLGWSLFFALCRLYDISAWMGTLVMEATQ
jgi:cobalt/nickel transport system permease protein